MSKKSILELVELARLAPRVEPGIDKGEKKTYSSISKFMKLSGFAAGRNLVPKEAVYEVYADWAEEPLTQEAFHKKMSKILKSEKGRYKANMHIATLVNKIGEES